MNAETSETKQENKSTLALRSFYTLAALYVQSFPIFRKQKIK